MKTKTRNALLVFMVRVFGAMIAIVAIVAIVKIVIMALINE